MSVKVSSWVWHEASIQDIKGNDLVLLLALADVANDKGVCAYWETPEDASYSGLAAKARIHRSTIAVVLERLKKRGVLEVMRQGPGHPNQYRILIGQESGIATPDSGIPTPRVASPGLHTSLIREDVIDPSTQPVRGSRISRQWRPSPSATEYLAQRGPSLDLEATVEDFLDYWIAQPGQKGVKTDWDAVWQGWVRRQHKWNVERGWQPASTAPSKNWALL